MYNNGQGAPRDYAEAMRGSARPPTQGVPPPSTTSGSCTPTARACRRTTPRRCGGIRKAADQGDAAAQYNLGVMYDNGQGVPQDYAEAVRWYRKAADQGDASAQYNLGRLYADGQGVRKDYVQALKWFNLAVASFPASDTANREKSIRDRDRVAAKMTPAQIAEAKRLARESKPKPVANYVP